MTASENAWIDEFSFLEKDDIDKAFLADTEDENRSEPVRGYSREDLYFEFSRRRNIGIRELSPDLSTSILDRYGFDPYSEDPFLDSEVLATQEGDEFLRLGYRDEAVYFQIGDSSLPQEPDYLEAEQPRWRA